PRRRRGPKRRPRRRKSPRGSVRRPAGRPGSWRRASGWCRCRSGRRWRTASRGWRRATCGCGWGRPPWGGGGPKSRVGAGPTAGYVERSVGERRGLRLLRLQAPVVAGFLLLGFAGKNFRQKLPLPRPLTPQERRTLVLVSRLERLLDEDRPLEAGQKAALKR